MKKRFFVAALAATMFATSALGLAACSKDGTLDLDGDIPGVGGGGGDKSYTITLDANGGAFTGGVTTKDVQTDKSGKISTQPAAPDTAKEDCTFKGWGLTASAASPIAFPKTFDSSIKIYALWTADDGGGGGGGEEDVPGTEYTITFNANGGTFTEDDEPVTRTTNKGKITTAQLPDVTREGFTLDGWYTAASGGNLVINTTFTANGIAYAHWTETPVGGDDDDGGGGGGGGDTGNNGQLTFEECVGDGAWLVGVIQERGQTWDTGWGNGYRMVRADDPNYPQYRIDVYLQAGDEVKIRYGNDGINYDQIENRSSLSCIAESADGNNYSILESGYYTFYFKYTWDSNKIWVVYPA
ncbi:MAG: InlB B-repeat-containing protein [Clostridiales bacterium]|nr:InlB B-repeat-containing protein [Clostridiales bacterium]